MKARALLQRWRAFWTKPRPLWQHLLFLVVFIYGFVSLGEWAVTLSCGWILLSEVTRTLRGSARKPT